MVDIVKIDPRLPLPNIRGAQYKEEEEVYSFETDQDIQNVDESSLPPEVINGGDVIVEYTIDPPTEFSVDSQTVKLSGDGSQTVDVVINIGDVPGAVEYELRIATT